MKTTIHITLFFLVLMFLPVFAQRPIKTDLLPFFEKVIPPPATAKDAFEKICVKSEEAEDPLCNSEPLFKPLKDQLENFLKEINATVLQDNMPNQDQIDMAKKFKDEKMDEKLKNMSKEEKIKWAMEMGKNMGPQATIESPAVIKAFQDASELTQAYSTELQKVMSNYPAEAEYAQKLEAKHKEIDDWERAEIEKLPNLSTGEMSYKDPQLVHNIKLKAAEKHIAVVDEELQVFGGKWADMKEKAKLRCAPFNESLAKCHYGNDAKNKMMVQSFASGQQLIINTIIGLIAESSKAYETSAPYYARKVKIEKEKID
ncbi:MAG: hypothetical protein NTX22_08370 [Ignavibacteriales bacterium]|nr:hypothetical protein [Ignavibacteriales bacterium]